MIFKKSYALDCLGSLNHYFCNPDGAGYAETTYKKSYEHIRNILQNIIAEEKADDYDIDEGDIVMDEDDNSEENYRDCMACRYDKKTFSEEPCNSCDSFGSNFEEKTCENCRHMNEIPFGGPCEDCENGHLDGWESIDKNKENETMNNQMKITSPWITFVNQINCLFADDTDVLVEYNDDKKNLVLKIFDSHRADALTQLLPTERNFGGVTLHISVVPANKEKLSFAELVETAMDANPHFSKLIKVPMQDGKSFNYLMFEPEVAQYWNDNLADPNGNVSTVYADLAQDVFGVVPGTFFATDC